MSSHCRGETASRDGLVEVGLKMAKVLAKMRIRHHEEIIDEITDYCKQGRKLKNKLINKLGEEDSVREGFSRVLLSLGMLQSEIEE